MMNKYIRTVFLLYEAVALAVIKPLHDSISHSDNLLSKNSQGSKLQVATLDKWIFPSERNRPANKDGPLLITPMIICFWVKSSYFFHIKSLFQGGIGLWDGFETKRRILAAPIS
jgi:hypothetical protein